jgi:hypothetical protein
MKSREALKNLKEICGRDFPGEYKIEMLMSGKIPVRLKKTTSLLRQRCFALRTLPAAMRKFIGTFADKDGSSFESI